MDRDWFDQLRTFVPVNLRSTMIIAGGYAAAPAEAGDIDIWIPSGDGPPLVSDSTVMRWHRDDILEHLFEAGITYVLPPPVGYNGDVAKRLVCTIPSGYAGKAVQLLVTAAHDAQELVDSFDISTHAVAKTQQPGKSMQVTFAKEWSSLREQPRVMRFTTPEETLARLHKVTQRYGTQPHAADVQRLIDAIEAKERLREPGGEWCGTTVAA